MWKFIGVVGFITIIGVCNDTATYYQIACFVGLGIVLMTLSVLFERHHQYKLVLVAPNGKRKIIYAYNLASKLLATRKYAKLGYKLETELETIGGISK